MSIYDSELWISDIDVVLEALPELDEISGKSILITGCTGLICSAIVDTLARWNAVHREKITIIAGARSEKKVRERFAKFFNEQWFQFVYYDATSFDTRLDFGCDYVVHGASNATPRSITNEPVETMVSNFMGIKLLLDFAKERNIKRVLFISSSEIYGKKEDGNPFKLDEYGYIDLLKSRNSYSIAKRAAETLCASYYDEYGVESVIVRPGHIYGPTASNSDNRVSSMWAYSVAQGKDIVMKSDGAQLRSYCYCLDCASAILKTLLRGNNIHAYNISNPKSIISIRDMAVILARHAGVELTVDIPTEEEKKGFNPMRNSSLDSSELESLGWRGMFDAETGLSHTVDIIRQSGRKSTC